MNKYNGPTLEAREQELAVLRPLSKPFPTLAAAAAEIARLSAELTLPKGTVHVISDVHGDDIKLRHVINNASGTLRPWLEWLFAHRLPPEEFKKLLVLIFYPRETLEHLQPALTDPDARRAFCKRTIGYLFEIISGLASRRAGIAAAVHLFPEPYRALAAEILLRSTGKQAGPADYQEAAADSLASHDQAFELIRMAVRVVRNLTIDELVLAGDCWDRGARGDRVVDYLQRQPNVSFIWGNHDAAWLGACLGHEPLIAHVLRISTRYRRLSQLEEGYGITLQPLEHLVRAVYADDPASCYAPKETGLRETQLMARMQKAAAIMQFKLEGQIIQRNPHFEMDHRRLLHKIDREAGTIEVDGKTYPLRDKHFPTIDPANPYELSAEERACLSRIRQSFLVSQKLWEHMRFLVQRGSMYLKRDNHLIFHGCVPVDNAGQFLPLSVDPGAPGRAGRELFDALDRVIVRVLDRPTPADLDLLWYLWCGPRSPLFGKDRITTLENDLVADPAVHVETKNPYFQLIHEAAFCDRILAEFGVDPGHGLIVNGHVPVKIEKGESPLKRSGKAITIDGAFSAAYGDHGYTLVLEPNRTFLAEHHHFDSVDAAVRDGVDIIPTLTTIRKWDAPRCVADTEHGDEIRQTIHWLERLMDAYRSNQIRQA